MIDEPMKVEFEDAAALRLCSANECRNGHAWPAQITVKPCSGCSSPILLVRMQLCPVCNEPAERVRLRSEHVPSGATIAARCKGEESGWEAIEVVMERTPMEQRLEKKEVAN